MADMSVTGDRDPKGPRLDAAPPRPPRQGQSLMSMANGPEDLSGMMDMANPAVRAMKAMGTVRNGMLELAAILPPLSMGLQQIMAGLEQVVPQMVADIVAGNPPGSSGAGMGGGPGAPDANTAPTAPPVSAGVP